MTVLKATVLEATMVASRVLNLKLKAPEGFTWQTGQFALLGLPVEGREVFRCYSLASLPGSGVLEFFIAIVPSGVLSHRLAKLTAADTVLLDTTTGGLLLASGIKPGGKDLWFFASGTGVAPFLGLLQENALVASFESVTLVHSINAWEDADYVAKRLVARSNFRYICSAPKEEKAAIRVFVQEALKDGSLEALVGRRLTKEASRVMICGNPPMVKSLSAVLADRSITPEFGELQIEQMGF